MIRIKKVDVMSIARVSLYMYAAIGLIIGGIVAVISILGSATTGDMGGAGAFIGVGVLIGMPVMYGILGFIGGIILGWTYNVAARFTGGFLIELEQVAVPTVPTAPAVPAAPADTTQSSS